MQIKSHKLSNGLTILVIPRKTLPKISFQLFYDVGSKNELTKEKGIAHLIEHMIFKGTSKLSECDINLITQKLSAYSNAFTSYDYTGYLFDVPSQHWHEILTVLADSMVNTSFKEEFLNSELKAVIQELKMYKDDYISSLIEKMMSSMFKGHPYSYPIIGYKQDLWNLTSKDLLKFYKKYYTPSNATLVAVGDIDPEELFEQAEIHFGNIKNEHKIEKQEFYLSPDLESHSTTIYRDIKQPILLFSWVIPGLKDKKSYLNDIISRILGSGRSSRLYKLLVDELQLAIDLECFNYDLFEHGALFIYVKPKNINDIDTIKSIIKKEVLNLQEQDLSEEELRRVMNKASASYLYGFQNNQKIAYALGKDFLATGNKNYILDYYDLIKFEPNKVNGLIKDIKGYFSKYLKPYLINTGQVLTVQDNQKDYWKELQIISDKEDERILKNRERTSELEQGCYVNKIKIEKPKRFNFPEYDVITLSNGMKVLYYNNSELPMINLTLDFKVKHYYDPENLQGICNFTSEMMLEDSSKYSGAQFANILESYGMSISNAPGGISMNMLSKDFAKGLELLNNTLVNASFKDADISKIRDQIFNDINDIWDDPLRFTTILAKSIIYKDHPYSKRILGTRDSIASISRDDLLDFYKLYSNPKGARLSIVGDISKYKDDLTNILEKAFGNFKSNKEIPEVDMKELKPLIERKSSDNSDYYEQINYPINRDQITLCFAGLSVDRTSSDYDKLLLFDQIFTGGIIGSMGSRLFELRERSGLFYTIGGSLLYNSGNQPGMMLIKTLVSLDSLDKSEKAISKAINTACDSITQQELTDAQQAIANSMSNNFADNKKIARTFLFLDKNNLPKSYFDDRAQAIMNVKPESISKVVKKYLNIKNMVLIKAGRI